MTGSSRQAVAAAVVPHPVQEWQQSFDVLRQPVHRGLLQDILQGGEAGRQAISGCRQGILQGLRQAGRQALSGCRHGSRTRRMEAGRSAQRELGRKPRPVV